MILAPILTSVVLVALLVLAGFKIVSLLFPVQSP
jgi:hypothetical protein